MKSLIAESPVFNEAYDATTKEAHAYYTKVKNWFLNQNESLVTVDQQARKLGDKAIPFRTMLKFYESELSFQHLDQPLLLTLINPVYKETGRLRRREDHPHGENSLQIKIECIRYFESLNANFKGRIFVVDDGCPNQSGAMAKDIIDGYPDSPHRVFFLDKAIDDNDPELPPGITHKSGTNRSVKGGAVLFGMRKALLDEVDHLHIIVDNDADLSIHPMQLGLLIKDIVNNKAKAIAGSRREEDSVALIGAGRNQRGSLFIKIWQSLLPDLARGITDTNRAFKAFESEELKEILPFISTYTFPYQIELLQACISKGIELRKQGIAYLDSEAASTQSGEEITETYLSQIHQIIDISRRYSASNDKKELISFFERISENEWMKIEENPSDELLELLGE